MGTNQTEAYFIGIDGGTTVIKSVLFDLSGNELDKAEAQVPIESPQPGFQEQDMHLVWQAAQGTLRELTGRNPQATSKIRAIGITAQGAGCWLIDEQGEPVGNAILWSDGRAAEIINQWEQDKSSDEIYEICGSIQWSGCQGAILNWLAQHDPEKIKAASHVLWCKDWITYKLSGVVATDPSDASVSYLDTEKWRYSPRLLEVMDITEYSNLLPEVQLNDHITGTILPEVASDLGLPSDVAVVAGPFDMTAAAIGVGAVASGQACSILGTALISEVVLDQYISEPKNVGFTISHSVPNYYLRAMAAMLGTPNLDWFIEQFCSEDQAKAQEEGQNVLDWLEPHLAEIPIGSGGIIYHPYLSPAGERSPFVNENVRAQFVGLSQDHTRHHVLRAVYEGVALAVKHCYDSIPGKISSVSLSGGGARSALWCQIIAEALDAEVIVPSGTEFGAKGAAINAMVAMEYYPDYTAAVDQMVRFERRFAPVSDHHTRYQELYGIYQSVYRVMGDTWDALAAFRQKA